MDLWEKWCGHVHPSPPHGDARVLVQYWSTYLLSIAWFSSKGHELFSLRATSQIDWYKLISKPFSTKLTSSSWATISSLGRFRVRDANFDKTSFDKPDVCFPIAFDIWDTTFDFIKGVRCGLSIFFDSCLFGVVLGSIALKGIEINTFNGFQKRRKARG